MLHLNDQILTLLSQRGIPDKSFYRLLNEEIRPYVFSLIENRAAFEHILRLKLPFFNSKSLAVCGRNLTKDNFLRSSMIESFQQRLEELRTGRRILIPEHEGRNMMGVLDETGQLEYGQVFVQYSSNEGFKVLKGPVIVSKMPALHPGDVRKLIAVNIVSGLKHMRDVIVFPQKGPRPHPNEMAGSDLDGDLYFVTWREDLILKKDNYPAMHFPPGVSTEKHGDICEKDLIQYVKDFIKTDKTGIIARQHLINADFRKDGIESPECLELAKIHSLAVDASKTGEVATLELKLKLSKVPDFLEKSDHKISYPSTKIIGKLFTRTKQISAELDKFRCGIQDEDLSRLTNDPDITQIIVDIHSLYCSSIEKLKNEYGIQNEINLWNGKAAKAISEHKQKNLRRSLVMLQQDLHKIVDDFTKQQTKKSCRYSIWKGCFYISKINPEKRDICCSGLPWLLFDKLLQSENQLNLNKELGPEKLLILDVEMYTELGKTIIRDLRNKIPTSCFVVRVTKQLFNSNIQEGLGFLNKFRVVVQKDLWIVFALEYILQQVKDPSIENSKIDDDNVKTYFEIFQCIFNVLVSQDFAPHSYLFAPQPETTYWQKLKLLLWKNSELDNVESAYKQFPVLEVNEYSKLGKLVIYTLWEVYAIASDLIPETVKAKALSSVFELASYDGHALKNEDSEEIEETTILDKNSFGYESIPTQAAQQENLDFIKLNFEQKFQLSYLCISQHENINQIRCVYRGLKHDVERFKCSLEQFKINHTSTPKRNLSSFRKNVKRDNQRLKIFSYI